MALLISAAPGGDIAIKEDRIFCARAFANKLWNASRWLFLYMEKSGVGRVAVHACRYRYLSEVVGQAIAPLEDAWIFEKLNACAAT